MPGDDFGDHFADDDDLDFHESVEESESWEWDMPYDWDSDELVEHLSELEFVGGEFLFEIHMSDGFDVSISVDMDGFYELYEWLEDYGFDFDFGYLES